MLKIRIPIVCVQEQHYIINVMLKEFLGIGFEIIESEQKYIEITKPGSDARFSLNADFFHLAHKSWLQSESMPQMPLSSWNPSDDGIEVKQEKIHIPVLYGKPGLKKNGLYFHVNLDLFGSAFFMLSRYEELITADRDEHDRFPAWASIAYKEGFLERPIVNEYLEFLWGCLTALWPNLVRKKRLPINNITCDIDLAFYPPLHSFKKMIFKAGEEVIYDFSPKKAVMTSVRYLKNKMGFKVYDQYRNNISWMMDVNESVGNRISFYFITHYTSKLDINVDFESPEMRCLIREIAERGHEIGLHPGYNCVNNRDNFNISANKLKRLLQEEGIEQSMIGGRMHYLRWDMTKTPYYWEDNNFDYDSTLMFADRAGFRCGTSYEYTMYDLIHRQNFRLKQKPLIVMECSVIDSRYENLGYTKESFDRFNKLKYQSHFYDGEYTLLWHNTFFTNNDDKTFYQQLIQ